MASSADTPPSVGLCCAWFDPTEPKAWSGITHNVISAFERLGVYSGFRDATPWMPGGKRIAATIDRIAASGGGNVFERRLVRPWLRHSGRATAWGVSPEVRFVGAVCDAVRRARTPKGVDAWLILGAARAVRGRYATLCDLSPSQFATIGPRGPGSYWMPGATISQIDAHARQLTRTHRAAYVCCVASQWAARSLAEDHGIAPSRIKVVGFGHNVDLASATNIAAARDWSLPRFLFVGRDWTRKNGAAVVRAFSQIRRELPRATLDIVGNHPRISEDGVTGHGELSSAVPEQQATLDALWARSTCFVMPSVVEPFGIVYLEAAAFSIPSIATDLGGTADAVGEGGFRVAPDDDRALVDTMRRLAQPDLAVSLGKTARQHAEQYTWDRVAQRVLDALDLPPSAPQSALAGEASTQPCPPRAHAP